MPQKTTHGIQKERPPKGQELTVRHIKCKKGSATTYGTLNDERLRNGLQVFLEDLDRQGKLDGLLEEIRSKERNPKNN